MKRWNHWVGVIAIGIVALTAGRSAATSQVEVPKLDGAITGRVINPSGAPAPKVRVVALTEPENPDQPTAAAESSSRPTRGPANSTLMSLTFTDEGGNYRLEGIPAGRYLIALGALDDPIYFPGVRSVTEARIVSTLPDGSLENVDFNLNVPLTLKVSGRVIRDGHQAGTTALLNGPSTELIDNIAPDGTFEFPSVKPGTYQLRIGPNLTSPAPTTIVVTTEDIVGLKIPIPSTAVSAMPVTFKLSVPNGAPVPKVKLVFVPLPSMTQPGEIVTISSPTYESAMAVGAYRLTSRNSIQLPPGYSVQSIMAGTTDLTKSPFNVVRSGVSPITIALSVASPPWVRLAGKVTGLDNSSIRPTHAAIHLPGFVTPVTAPITAEGAFEFPFVLPGRHRIELTPAADPFSRVVFVGETGQTDARIPLVISSVKVSGRVTDIPASTPLPSVAAWLTPEPVATGLQSFSAPIAQDGAFIFKAVPAGRYQLSMRCEETGGMFNPTHHCPPTTGPRLLVPVATRDVGGLIVAAQ